MSFSHSEDWVVTPGRKTYLTLDDTATVLQENPFSLLREKHEIARKGLNTNRAYNLFRFPTQEIGLEPHQINTYRISERTVGNVLTIPMADFNMAQDTEGYDLFVEKPHWRYPSELSGMAGSPPAHVPSASDYFIHKFVSAVGTLNTTTHDPDVDAFGRAVEDSLTAPMDRVAVSKFQFAAGQGFCVRFELSATKQHAPDHIKTFYFGGPRSDDGSGQYALIIRGNGYCNLQERVDGTWVKRDKFRYAMPEKICYSSHQILIFPHAQPRGGGTLSFLTSMTEEASPIAKTLGYYQPNTETRSHVYRIKYTDRVTPDRPMGKAPTGTGVIRIDNRRDIKVVQQISLIKYPEDGAVNDEVFALRPPTSSSQPLVISWLGVVPEGCTLVGKLYDATTDDELVLLSSGATSRTYETPAGQRFFYARFEFTSDGNDTARLSKYSVIRNGVLATRGTTPIAAERWLNQVSLTGAEADPSHESCNFVFEDLTNALTILNRRGRIPYTLAVGYDPLDPDKRSILSKGILMRTTGKRRTGKGKEGFGGAGAPARVYPSPYWRQYTSMGVGEWMRLAEKRTAHRYDFSDDGTGQPCRITDVVRQMLQYAGYPLDEIDIPHSEIRLWAAGGDTKTLVVEPLTDIGPYVLGLLHDYLGWSLVRDENAGTTGMWRGVKALRAPYTNLATFAMEPTGNGKVVHRPESYGSTNWVSEEGAVTTFIRKGTLETWVKPPEANCVVVISGVGEDSNDSTQMVQFLINRDGGDFFPDYTPDPLHPDWIGELVEVVYINMDLWTQNAVNFACRRLYETVTHGIKMARFEAPLIFITDPDDPLQTKPRPLRYYDPVLISDGGVTSQWLVRNVNPFWSKSSKMMAIYELEAPRV